MKKIERNAPCPCGSGKKYKQCCLKRDEALAANKQTEAVAIPGALQEAIGHHQAGRLTQAEAIYRQILQVEPDHSDALHLLGVAAHQVGNDDLAVELINKAIRANPANPMCYLNLGNALKDQGKLDAALESYQKSLAYNPVFAEAHYHIGLVLQAQNKLDAAVMSYRRALELKPIYAEAHYNLANILHVQGKLDAAVESYLKVLEIKPDYAEAHANLASVLQAQRILDAAVKHYQQALLLKPDLFWAFNNLGVILMSQGKLDEAVERYQQALLLKPDFAEARCNLGNALKDQGKLNDAAESFRQVLLLEPNLAEAHNNLSLVLQEQGLLDEVAAHCRRALEIKPDYAEAYSNLLFTLNYHPDLSSEEIFAAYREFDERFGLVHREKWQEHGNSRETGRRLKVGYVSPDFRRHSSNTVLEPLLAHHDKTLVEVYAYAELHREDEVTARYRSYADHWIATKGMSDDALAERIRNDGIDILVDLAGHTGGNRLLTFARKPAPVSLSWLGFGYTSGMSAIDYYLADAILAPLGSEGFFAEQPWCLSTFPATCRPAAGMGEISSLPAQQRGYVTFGTLTRSVRINHRSIRVWSEILKRVEGARLVIDSASFKEPAMQERMAARFAEYGITRDRLEIGFHSPPWDVLRDMDIGLDCFPHNSGTTLFETLYMGVPYVTLAGRPSVGCLGSSLLHAVGHPEWIAKSEDEYVELAVALASDVIRLSEIRSTLRDQVQASSLGDEEGFARKVENAYRGMWTAWCEARNKN